MRFHGAVVPRRCLPIPCNTVWGDRRRRGDVRRLRQAVQHLDPAGQVDGVIAEPFVEAGQRGLPGRRSRWAWCRGDLAGSGDRGGCRSPRRPRDSASASRDPVAVGIGGVTPHLSATSDIRCTMPRLSGLISAPMFVTARWAMCSARSPLRSNSGRISRTPTRWRSVAVGSASTSSCRQTSSSTSAVRSSTAWSPSTTAKPIATIVPRRRRSLLPEPPRPWRRAG